MKKVVLTIVMIVSFSLFSVISAESSQSLYTLNVPYSYQSLYLSGQLGSSEVIQIEIDTSAPVTFRADIGIDGDYDFISNTEDTKLELSSAGTYARVGSSGIQINAAGDGEYKTYSLSIGPFDGFYGFGGSAWVYLNVPFPGTTTFNTSIRPYATAGIGRLYSIASVKQVTNMLEYLDLEVTDEKVLEIATYMEKRNEFLNTYTDDYASLFIDYIRGLTEKYGMEGKELELIYATLSEQLDFALQRYNGLEYGWEAYVQASPGLFFETSTTNTFSFDFALEIGGKWAMLMADETVYVEAAASVTPTVNTSATQLFYVLADADLIARYFFPSPRMWVDSQLSLNFNPLNFTTFDLDIEGEFNYLIQPNFTAFAGARMINTFDKLALFAGANMRLF